MELDHEFTVPVPVDRAWPVLLDVERIAPCMPGATLDSVEGDEFAGRLKVKLGAMTITYKGTARIAAKDEQARTVTIEGTGKEARGSGTAAATVQAQLHDEGEQTRVAVHTKLNVTGRPAQFGRNIMSEVGGKLIGRFAKALSEEIARPAPAEEPSESAADRQPGPVEATGGTPTEPAQHARVAGRPEEPSARHHLPPRAEEAIDLLEVAGPAVAKRAAPVVAGLFVLFVLWRLLRRRKS